VVPGSWGVFVSADDVLQGRTPEEHLRREYNRIARRLDGLRQDITGKPYNVGIEQPAMMAALEEELAVRDDSVKVYELGCGGGLTMEALLNAPFWIPGSQIAGVDFSSEMIEIARERLPGISFHTADARTQIYDPDTFDLIYASLMIHNVEQGLFDEVHRILKPGGSFLFTTGHRMGITHGTTPTSGIKYATPNEDGTTTLSDSERPGSVMVAVADESYFDTDGLSTWCFHDEHREPIATMVNYKRHEGELVRELSDAGLLVARADPLYPSEALFLADPRRAARSSMMPLFALYKAVKVNGR
jgi:SAM-dependent methyltransferase